MSRSQFLEAEEEAIAELKKIGKPFVVIVNSVKPNSDDTRSLCQSIEEKYQVKCLSVNCEQLHKQDIDEIMKSLLYEFPISDMEFYMPHWFDVLPKDHELKLHTVELLKEMIQCVRTMRDFRNQEKILEQPWIKKYHIESMDMSNGRVKVYVEFDMKYYYEMLSELLHTEVHGEYAFYQMIKNLADQKQELDQLEQAMKSVRNQGYGMVMPISNEVVFEEPELIHHGGKYGVGIKAKAPSIHMVEANIETEIAPIVGNKDQAEDLLRYIVSNRKEGHDAMWNTLIFGKSVGQLVEEGIQSKVDRMTDDSRLKIQETMQKIMNDSNGGVVFVII